MARASPEAGEPQPASGLAGAICTNGHWRAGYALDWHAGDGSLTEHELQRHADCALDGHHAIGSSTFAHGSSVAKLGFAPPAALARWRRCAGIVAMHYTGMAALEDHSGTVWMQHGCYFGRHRACRFTRRIVADLPPCVTKPFGTHAQVMAMRTGAAHHDRDCHRRHALCRCGPHAQFSDRRIAHHHGDLTAAGWRFW